MSYPIQALEVSSTSLITHHYKNFALLEYTTKDLTYPVAKTTLKGSIVYSSQKKELGRPIERKYPPRIDATPDQLAEVLLWAGRPKKGVDDTKVNRCAQCEREVYCPETLYNDGKCPECHAI